MSQFGLNSALWEIYKSKAKTEEFQRDPQSFSAEFELTDNERRAFVSLDLPALLQAGAHPFLMYKATLRNNGPMTFDKLREYVKKLEGFKLRDIVT